MARPKLDNPASTADRLSKSRSALAEAGGQRLEIRLSSSAAEDLEIVMALRNLPTKKAAIEWCLMACRTAVVHTDTKMKSTT